MTLLDCTAASMLNACKSLTSFRHSFYMQCDFQAIYASGIKGKAGLSADNLADDLGPLFESIMRCIPGPAIDKDGSLQMLVSGFSLMSSFFLFLFYNAHSLILTFTTNYCIKKG